MQTTKERGIIGAHTLTRERGNEREGERETKRMTDRERDIEKIE